MTPFAVMVRGSGDTFFCYGPVPSEQRAQSFADWFNARVEAYEQAHPAVALWAYVIPLIKLEAAALLKDSGLPLAAADDPGETP